MIAAPADATLTSLSAFDDPSQWDCITRGVPIFCEHHLKTKDSKGQVVEYSVDVNRLKRIAANAQKLFRERGVPIFFTDGHIIPDPRVPQSQQPIIHGYGVNPRFGNFGPEKKPCVLVDMYTRKGHMPAVRELPFRSSDFQYDSDQITSVALLRTWPQLDLGFVHYRKSQPFSYTTAAGNHLSCYAANFTSENHNMPDPTFPPDANATNEPDMASMGAGNDEYGKTKPHVEQYMKECYPHLKDYHDKHIVQAMGGMAAPSGTNGLPGAAGASGDSPPGADPSAMSDPVMPYSNDPAVMQYQRKVTDENQQLRRQLVEAQRSNRVAQYSKDIADLSLRLSVPLDPAQEVTGHEDDSTDKWASHLKFVERVATAARGPVGGSMIQLARSTGKSSEEITDAQSDKIIQYIRQHQMSGPDAYEKAKAAVLGGA